MSSRGAEFQGLAIEALESRDADLEARNADLGLRNGELSAQVAALEERLERQVSRNSGDSSMPSSSDDLPGRKVPGQRKRGGTGKRPGKKPGAPVHLHADPRVRYLLSAPDT
jgi:hypothetical protein